MDPLSITASIIAVIQLTGTVVSAVYGYRRDVKSAPEDAARIIQDLVGLSQVLEKLLQMVEQDKSANSTRLASLKGLINPDGPLDSCQKTLERLNGKLPPEGGWRGVKQSLVWPLRKDYIKKTLDDIAAAKATMALALSVDQVSLAIETKAGVAALASSFDRFRLDEERKAALSKIAPTDAAVNHLKARKKHQAGTGDWLLESKQYLEWVDKTDSVFWINGIHSVKVLERQSQLVFSNEYLISIIEGLLQEFRDVYIVIDALDECEGIEEVLQWIEGLVDSKIGSLHLLVSSRQDHHFRSILQGLASSILDLDQDSFDKDIQKYIRKRLSTDLRMMKWPSIVQDDVEQSLISNAGGLFRWVECQLDVLRKCIRINNIRNVLDTPPKTLYETYDRIINGIDEAYAEDALKILQWLAFSARPLRTSELNEILAFDRSDPQKPVFSPHLRLPVLQDVLSICSSLVTVFDGQAIGHGESEINSLEVRLAHNSVKDYLTSHHINNGSTQNAVLEAQLAHAVMSECCLVYLLQFHDQLDIATLQEFPLALYAAQSWFEHYRHCKDSQTGLLDKLAQQLLTTEAVYRNCCCLHNPDRRWQGMKLEANLSPSALYYASLTGLSPIVRCLVGNGADPNEDDFRGILGQALDAAAYKGYQETVQALLDAGADPDGNQEGEYGSPIAAAASQGQISTVRMLLRAGANVNKRGVDGQGSALYQAVYYKQLGTVKMLVDAGSSVNTFAGLSGVKYAIEVAAHRGDREMLCVLYSKASKWGVEMALKAVGRSRNRNLFDILLQYQRDRELELKYAGWSDLVQHMVGESLKDASYDSSTAATLCQAAAAGSLETTQILYENRLEKTFSSDELGEAVAAAAGGGHTLVVRYLLDRGADTKDERCQKALLQAAEGGHSSTVQTLLTAGVPANLRTEETIGPEESKASLWAAVDQEHIEIVRLLLFHGANPDTQYFGTSALSTSIEKANQGIFDLLLHNGASTEVSRVYRAEYDTLRHPIHCATSSGNMHILRALLEKGLESDSVEIPDGWTALFHAAKAGHEEVLRLLINNYGADANRRANKGTAAIHTAAYHNHEKCIEAFLDAGVDVNVPDWAGRTALHWATQEGSIDAIRVLLNKNANVLIEQQDNFMKAAEIAKARILEIAESKASGFHFRRPREDNYRPILEMLEDREARSQHTPPETPDNSDMGWHVID